MNDLGIKVAFVTSERLYDYQRDDISRVFACPVANGYGGRDAGFIAHQCPHGGMHITAEDIIVEIVDKNGFPLPCGEAGEVVVTHLATGDFPFIRYRTGDVAVMSEKLCSCGRGLPVWRKSKEELPISSSQQTAQSYMVWQWSTRFVTFLELPHSRSFKKPKN